MSVTRQYIGVDYSTRKFAAVRLTVDRDPMVRSRELPPKQFPDRVKTLTEIHYLFSDFLADQNPRSRMIVAIESPIMGMSRDVQTAIWMAMTAGGLVLAAADWHIDPLLVAPGTWKKRVTGHGNASKNDVAQWLGDTYPYLDQHCSNDDERDAMCLALYAKAIDKERTDADKEAEEIAGGR